MLLCARAVKSHSNHPLEGIIGSVDLVISDGEQTGVLLHVALDSEKLEQACADIVVEAVPATLALYIFKTIEVGVIADGHGACERSNSR